MTTEEVERYKPLARRLAAAFIAHQHGIGLDYAYRTYAKDEENVGSIWIQFAELIWKRMAMQKCFDPFGDKPTAPGVQ